MSTELTSALYLDGSSLTIDDLMTISCPDDLEPWSVAEGARTVDITPLGWHRVRQSRQYVESILSDPRPHYGISTGFGALRNVQLPQSQLDDLQLNLVTSHAAGIGDPITLSRVKRIMTVRLNVFAKGYSGITVEVASLLRDIINNNVIPYVPSRGSVGASGDLAPSAHIALTLIGLGTAWSVHQHKWIPSREALAEAGLTPVVLKAKEGLSVLNGTHMMAALTAEAVWRARRAAITADVVAACTMEALRANVRMLDPRVHAARGQVGQAQVAERLRLVLNSPSDPSELRTFAVVNVQDAYSLRCTPQVHGAVCDGVRCVWDVVSREINAATDNPLVMPDGVTVSAGNFHGEYVAKAADALAVYISEIASISERRIERLLNCELSGPTVSLQESARQEARIAAALARRRRARAAARAATTRGTGQHPHDDDDEVVESAATAAAETAELSRVTLAQGRTRDFGNITVPATDTSRRYGDDGEDTGDDDHDVSRNSAQGDGSMRRTAFVAQQDSSLCVARHLRSSAGGSVRYSLPPFLIPTPGLNSGFMITHCAAAALVSENKVLVHPASCDSISTSAAQEDHVSMGAFAAIKAIDVVKNVEAVVACELLCALQAIDLICLVNDEGAASGLDADAAVAAAARPTWRSTTRIEAVKAAVREKVPVWTRDRIAQIDMDAVTLLVRAGTVLRESKVRVTLGRYGWSDVPVALAAPANCRRALTTGGGDLTETDVAAAELHAFTPSTPRASGVYDGVVTRDDGVRVRADAGLGDALQPRPASEAVAAGPAALASVFTAAAATGTTTTPIVNAVCAHPAEPTREHRIAAGLEALDPWAAATESSNVPMARRGAVLGAAGLRGRSPSVAPSPNFSGTSVVAAAVAAATASPSTVGTAVASAHMAAGAPSRGKRLRVMVVDATLCTPRGATPRGRYGAAAAALAGADAGRLDVLHDHGFLVRHDGVIVAVGPSAAIIAAARAFVQEGGVIDKEIALGGRAVVPGFVDAHTHACFSGDRGGEVRDRIAGTPYAEVAAKGGGIHFTTRATAAASAQELAASLRGRLDAMLCSGTTTVEVKSGYGYDTATELRMLRSITAVANDHAASVIPNFCGAHVIPPGVDPKDRWKDVADMLGPLADAIVSGDVAPMWLIDAFVDKGFFPEDGAIKLFDAAASSKLQLIPAFHGDELTDAGAGRIAKTCGAASVSHLEEITAEGIADLAASGAVGVLLPTTAFVLRLKHPPARDLIDAGVPLAVATDFNPNAPTTSIPTALAMAAFMLRMSPEECIVAATQNAAAALLVAHQVGSIEVGKLADFNVLSTNSHAHIIYLGLGGLSCTPTGQDMYGGVTAGGGPLISAVYKAGVAVAINGRVVHTACVPHRDMGPHIAPVSQQECSSWLGIAATTAFAAAVGDRAPSPPGAAAALPGCPAGAPAAIHPTLLPQAAVAADAEVAATYDVGPKLDPSDPVALACVLSIFAQGLPVAPLPPYPDPVQDPRYPHAPKRPYRATSEERRLAIKNVLRYFPRNTHKVLAKDFARELDEYGHIYCYRFKPRAIGGVSLMRAWPQHLLPATLPSARCIMHMILNNLDPAVAQFPEELVTYGGNGSVFSNWAQFWLTMHYLAQLTPQQTLVLSSGHPAGLFASVPTAPRMVVSNGLTIGNASAPLDYERLYYLGVSQYGQMTAGSFCYIGPQGIVHGTTLTLQFAARKYLGNASADSEALATQTSSGTRLTASDALTLRVARQLAGKVYLTSGLGGMSGAQAKASVISGAIGVIAEVDAAALKKRYDQGWLSEWYDNLDEVVARIRALRAEHAARSDDDLLAQQRGGDSPPPAPGATARALGGGSGTSIGYLGNVVDLWERLVAELRATGDRLVDLGSDQTSLHNASGGGYIPVGYAFDDAKQLLASDPPAFAEAVASSLRRQTDAINEMAAAGMAFWDYGNCFLRQAELAGADIVVPPKGSPAGASASGTPAATAGQSVYRFPTYFEDIMGHVFGAGFGPFRWICTSGSPGDVAVTDMLAAEVLARCAKKATVPLVRDLYALNSAWIARAASAGLIVGSLARILYADADARCEIATAFNNAVAVGTLRGPVVLSRDHHDVSGTDAPFRETSDLKDGSNVCADMATHNAIGLAMRGASWVALHNGGGTGWGNVINGGFGMVLDGSADAGSAAVTALRWDVWNGITRRAWSGNSTAMAMVDAHHDAAARLGGSGTVLTAANVADDAVVDSAIAAVSVGK